MDAWIGPAIVAAIVSGLVSVVGWLVTFCMNRQMELDRRAEKVRDFQTALRAEIASDLLNMIVADRSQFLSAVTAAYEADPQFVPFIPRFASNMVFEAILKEIHILPGKVIEPVVDYARMRQTLERFVEDMRAESFRKLPAQRQLTMYSDYLAMFDRLEALAQNALGALDLSLGLNNSGVGPSTPRSASEPGVVSAGKFDEP